MIFYSRERQGTLGSAYDSVFGRSEHARESPGGSLCATSEPNGNPSDSKIVKKSDKTRLCSYIFAASMPKGPPAGIFTAGGSHWDGKKNVGTAQA